MGNSEGAKAEASAEAGSTFVGLQCNVRRRVAVQANQIQAHIPGRLTL